MAMYNYVKGGNRHLVVLMCSYIILLTGLFVICLPVDKLAVAILFRVDRVSILKASNAVFSTIYPPPCEGLRPLISFV